MKRLLPLALVLATTATARADDPYKGITSTDVPKCSWSTMKAAEYKHCKDMEEHFKKMSPDEKKQHDEAIKQVNGQTPPEKKKEEKKK